MVEQTKQAFNRSLTGHGFQEAYRVDQQVGILFALHVVGHLGHQRRRRMRGQLLENRRPHVRLRIVEQLDERVGRAVSADRDQTAEADLANQRVEITEQLEQQCFVVGARLGDQFFGGPMADVDIRGGEPAQSARPGERQGIRRDEPIAQRKQPLSGDVGRRLLQLGRDQRRQSWPQPDETLGQCVCLRVRKLREPGELTASIRGFFRLQCGRGGDRIGRQTFGPFSQRRLALGRDGLRSPRVEISDRRFPLLKEFQDRQARRQFSFRKRVDRGGCRCVGVGSEPANGRFAVQRVGKLKQHDQLFHRPFVGRTFGGQERIRRAAATTEILTQPREQLVGRHVAIAGGDHFAARVHDAQRRNRTDIERQGFLWRGVGVDIDERPATKLLLDLRLRELLVELAARAAPTRPRSNQQRSILAASPAFGGFQPGWPGGFGRFGV